MPDLHFSISHITDFIFCEWFAIHSKLKNLLCAKYCAITTSWFEMTNLATPLVMWDIKSNIRFFYKLAAAELVNSRQIFTDLSYMACSLVFCKIPFDGAWVYIECGMLVFITRASHTPHVVMIPLIGRSLAYKLIRTQGRASRKW